MSKRFTGTATHLFIVRVWQETVKEGHTEWRGRVQHVPSGEHYYFREWLRLVEYLLRMLPDEDEPPMAE